MSTPFMTAPKYLFTSESVTEGHPDKLCDQVSDAILDAIIAGDPDARVACECSATTGMVVVMGEITTSTYIDMPTIVRRTMSYALCRKLYVYDRPTVDAIVTELNGNEGTYHDLIHRVANSLPFRETVVRSNTPSGVRP